MKNQVLLENLQKQYFLARKWIRSEDWIVGGEGDYDVWRDETGEIKYHNYGGPFYCAENIMNMMDKYCISIIYNEEDGTYSARHQNLIASNVCHSSAVLSLMIKYWKHKNAHRI